MTCTEVSVFSSLLMEAFHVDLDVVAWCLILSLIGKEWKEDEEV